MMAAGHDIYKYSLFITTSLLLQVAQQRGEVEKKKKK